MDRLLGGTAGQWFSTGLIPSLCEACKRRTGQAIQTHLVASCWPMWAPDSKRLLLVGKPDTKEAASISVDWWVVPLDNGPLVKTSALDSFNSQNLKPPLEHDWITPIGWLPGQNRILFSATQGDTTNLWEIAVSPAGKVIAPATRRTFTTSLDLHASVIGQANGAARRMFFQACLVT